MSKETGYTPFVWTQNETHYQCDLCPLDREREADMQEHIREKHWIEGLTTIPAVLPPLNSFGWPLDPAWQPPTLEIAGPPVLEIVPAPGLKPMPESVAVAAAPEQPAAVEEPRPAGVWSMGVFVPDEPAAPVAEAPEPEPEAVAVPVQVSDVVTLPTATMDDDGQDSAGSSSGNP